MNHSTPQTSTAGFTLVEILVVVTLGVVLTIGATSLFLTTLVSNSKKQIITAVKQEGDYSITQMEFLIRNAIALAPDPSTPLAPTCTSNMQRFTIKSNDNGITTFSITNGRIASQSSAPIANTIYLTSPDVTPSNLTFNCSQTDTNFNTSVNLSFTLDRQTQETNIPNDVNQVFSTTVNMRNL